MYNLHLTSRLLIVVMAINVAKGQRNYGYFGNAIPAKSPPKKQGADDLLQKLSSRVEELEKKEDKQFQQMYSLLTQINFQARQINNQSNEIERLNRKNEAIDCLKRREYFLYTHNDSSLKMGSLIPFDIPVSKMNANYDGLIYRATVPGVYHFTATVTVSWDNKISYAKLQIMLNGRKRLTSLHDASSFSYMSSSASAVVSLRAGDRIAVVSMGDTNLMTSAETGLRGGLPNHHYFMGTLITPEC